MAGRYFKVPFAQDGDRDVTPEPLQLDGSLSYEEGFGFDYERPAIDPITGDPDPLYKPIPREGWNGLMYDITEALGIIQRQGFADWTLDAIPYSANSWVRHNGDVWYSLVITNGEPGVSGDWIAVPLPSTRYAVGAGAANTYTANYIPALTALADGSQVSFRVSATNTGASTFSPNGLTAKPIRGLANLALQGSELTLGGTARLQFSTQLDAWILLSCDNSPLQIKEATQTQHAVTKAQLDSAIAAVPRYAVGAGAANVYTATYTPTLTALTDGAQVAFRVPNTNTGASTFSPDGLTAKPIRGLANLALQGGELTANGTARVQYSLQLDAWILLSCDNSMLQVKTATQTQHATTKGQMDAAIAAAIASIPAQTTSTGFIYYMGQI